jgi:glycosyltransferase involved in cell wall biosynthesis
MLGQGWSPSSIGGLDRYFRALLDQLPEASAVVVGPVGDCPRRVGVAATAQAGLARRLVAYLRAARRSGGSIDLLDAHFALYTAAALLSRSLRARPMVVHFHGPWADESVAAGDSSRIRLRLRRALERRVLRRAAAIVVLSGAFRRVLVERYAVDPWSVKVLAPGVDLEEFAPGDRLAARERLALSESAFVLACVRRLVPRVGVELLLRAWAELAGSLPSGSILLVAGDGELRAPLETLVGELGAGACVRFLGRVSDDELVDVYRAADAAAVPTIAHEGFGMVVLEAAACGTPSVVSDVGGLPEAIAGLDSSLVVSGGDPGAWIARLRSAAAGALPSREATRRYAERFDWPAVASRHRQLYRDVVGGAVEHRICAVFVCDSAEDDRLLPLLASLDVVAPHIILAEEGALVNRLHGAGVSVEVLAGRSGVLRLARRLRRLRPDLVHLRPSASRHGVLAARLAGVPVVREVAGNAGLPRERARRRIEIVTELPDDADLETAAGELLAAYGRLLGGASAASPPN